MTAENLSITQYDGEGEFKCSECPKVFMTYSGLKIHKGRAHK